MENKENQQQFELVTESNIKINGLSNINESLSVHYLIYRIDNLENSKHYIGQHQTENPLDSYMGSGKYLLRSIAKEGIEKFVKTILFDFDNFEEMNEKEKELVPLSSCYPNDSMSYNLREGGKDGNLSKESQAIRAKHASETWKNKSLEEKKRYSELKREQNLGKNNPMYGKNSRDFMSDNAIKQMDIKRKNAWKTKTKEELKIKEQKRRASLAAKSDLEKQKTHELLSKASAGKNNPMYGSTFVWMTNDKIHKRIRADKSKIQDFINKGYKIGYIFNS